MSDQTPDKQHSEEEPPPILKSWRNLYILVIGTLIVLIVLFYLLTKTFE